MRDAVQSGTEPALLGVAAAQHLGEGLDLVLAAALLAGLLVITLRAGALDDVLAIELLLQSAQGFFNRFAALQFDFGHNE